MRLRDIKQGRTIYLVMAFPAHDAEFRNNNSCVKKERVTSRPYLIPLGSKMMFVFDTTNRFGNKDRQFADTYNIEHRNDYNSHRAFWSRRKAEAYLKRTLRGCITPYEQGFADKAAAKYEKLQDQGFFDPIPVPFPERDEEFVAIQWLDSSSHGTVQKPYPVIRTNGV